MNIITDTIDDTILWLSTLAAFLPVSLGELLFKSKCLPLGIAGRICWPQLKVFFPQGNSILQATLKEGLNKNINKIGGIFSTNCD